MTIRNKLLGYILLKCHQSKREPFISLSRLNAWFSPRIVSDWHGEVMVLGLGQCESDFKVLLIDREQESLFAGTLSPTWGKVMLDSQ